MKHTPGSINWPAGQWQQVAGKIFIDQQIAIDLLAALQAILDGWDNWSDKDRIEGAIEFARNTIRKATGE